MPGLGELLVVLVIVLIIFGAGKLPQIGEALGRGIRNFKKAQTGADEIEVTPKENAQVAESKSASAGELNEPAAGAKEPVAEAKEPAAKAKEPVAEAKEPAAEARVPVVEAKEKEPA